MKTNKFLLAAILGMLTAATAGAQTTIYISGAPAVRSYVSAAIRDVLTSSTTGAITWAYSNGTTESNAIQKANALIFYGGNVVVASSTVPITVSVSYVGSSAGIQDVAATGTANFLALSSTEGGSPYPDPTASGAPAQDEEYPLFTASDEFQISTPWYGTNTLTTSGTETYAQLNSDIAGVIPYRFVASPDAPTRLSNITVQQARELWEEGFVWLSSLTGSTSANSGGAYPDDSEAIYALGRNTGSGLRTVLLSETGIGVTTSVKQFEPTISGTAAPYAATSQVLYPAGNVNGQNLAVGDNGYSSFTNLDPAISAYTVTNGGTILGSGSNYPAIGATKAIYVTALADADAQTAINNGAHEIAYNGFYLDGVPYNPTVTGSSVGILPAGGGASPELANGQYTFWSYIQLQYQSGLTTTTPVNPNTTTAQQEAAYAFEQALYQELKTTDAAVLLQNMNVSRSADGGTISKGNPY